MPGVDGCLALRKPSAGGVPVALIRKCEAGAVKGGDSIGGAGY